MVPLPSEAMEDVVFEMKLNTESMVDFWYEVNNIIMKQRCDE